MRRGFSLLGAVMRGCREGLLDQDLQIRRQNLREFMDDAILDQRDRDVRGMQFGRADSCPKENDRPRSIILSAGPKQACG